MNSVSRFCVLAVCMMTSAAFADDWPNWRGPRHDGISTEKGFKTTWTEAPKMLWEHPIGSAFSAFSVVGTKAYTCGTRAKMQVLYCFGVDVGKPIWEVPFEKELKERQGGDGTRSTPTVNDGRVYVFGAHGLLLCVDAETGKEIWKHQYNNKPHWAYSGSVLIEGDLAIVSPGKSDGALLALDKKTGKVVWTCGDEPAGYTTPYPFTFEGKRYVTVLMAKSAIIAEVATGKKVCSIPWTTDYDVNASALIYHEGHLFISTGYNTGAGLYKLAMEGDQIKATRLWFSKVLLTKFTSCVLADGTLYAGDQGAIKCVDFMTGKQIWQERRYPNASVLLANDQMIIFTEDGALMIAKASRDGLKPTAKAEILNGRCWTIATLSNGKLFVRNLEKAACVGLRPD